MEYFSQEKIWEVLLQIRNKVKNNTGDLNNVFVLCYDTNFEVHINTVPKFSDNTNTIIISKNNLSREFPKSVSFLFDDNYGIKLFKNEIFDNSQIEFLQLYLPHCFGAAKAHQMKRTISVLHFAQTLDGRIATESGNSKWIGNRDNLIHSHRMRALCDAIMIGTNTLRQDKPALTVRHVNGPNPLKIVIGNSICNFESLLENNGQVMFFTSNGVPDTKGVETIRVSGTKSDILPSLILKELYKKDIYSIYIEGGARTASCFLQDKSIDILQLFLAPKIFGSGVFNFCLPSISNVNESVEFTNSSFKPMGDGILFEGEVKY